MTNPRCLTGGIGPTDQLNIVKNSTDGETMIKSDSWINLPVGYNLNDHVGVRKSLSNLCMFTRIADPGNRPMSRLRIPMSSFTTTTMHGTTRF